ncbi:MAG: ASCH domain-containing protein [Tannerellaceae bacterium]|jgi:hypothetical protein|nr:ASCH domain-containing protein [Tannerellaceae bacterium]
MKTLSIKQPWAYLICAGIKDVENRTWNTNYRGRILIHAGAYKMSERKWADFFSLEQYRAITHTGRLLDQPRSAIIGSVEIVDCVGASPDMTDCFGAPLSIWAEPNCFHWILANPILFEKPIENVKGRLSFWKYECDYKLTNK